LNAVIIGHCHLFAYLFVRGGIYPAVRTRRAVVVKVVVHAVPARAVAVDGGQEADVAVVVIAEHDRYIRVDRGFPPRIGVAGRSVVETLDFLVNNHVCRDFVHPADGIADNFELLFCDVVEQGDVQVDALVGQGRRVVKTAQPERRDCLVIFGREHGLRPFLNHGVLIDICPRRGVGVGRAFVDPVKASEVRPRPFLIGAVHELLMAQADDDAVGVGQPAVLKVVEKEGVVPHSRPHEIAVLAQNHVEEFGVELVRQPVRAPVGRVDRRVPRYLAHYVVGGHGEVMGGGVLGHPLFKLALVVDEQAAVFYRGLALHKRFGRQYDFITVHRHAVREERERGNADGLRNFIEAINRAALVAARDYKAHIDARRRVGHVSGHV